MPVPASKTYPGSARGPVTRAECIAWLEQCLEGWAERGNPVRTRRAVIIAEIHKILSGEESDGSSPPLDPDPPKQ